MDRSQHFPRLVRHIGGHDLSVIPLPVLIWAGVLEVCDITTIVVVTLLRVASWILVLYVILLPARAAQQHGDAATVQELREANAAFATLRSYFMPFYIGGQVVMLSVSMGIGAAGWLPGIHPGRAELVFGAALVLMVLFAEWAMSRISLAGEIDAIRAELALQARSHDLEFAHSTDTLRGAVFGTVAPLMGCCAVLATVATGYLRIEKIREHSVERSHRLAEVAALNMQLGNPPDPTVFELLARSDLPPILTEAEAEAEVETTEVRRGYDHETQRALAAVRLPDGRWLLARETPEEQLPLLLLGLLSSFVFLLPPVLVVCNHLVNSMLAPLRRIDAATRELIETGQVGTIERVVVVRDDEAGKLGTNFNTLLDLLARLAATAGSVSEGDLSVEIEGQGDLYDAFRTMLTQLRGFVANLDQTSRELGAAAAEIQATSTAQHHAITLQAERMERLTGSVSALSATAVEIAHSSEEVHTNARETTATNEVLAREIAELSRRARGIGELLDLVREIADRSDLLALNGSLEATRAGDAGRGFALVAAEMRRLAERISATLGDVRRRLAEIDAASASTLSATENSQALAHATTRVAEGIASATIRHDRHAQAAAALVQEAREGILIDRAATSRTHAAAEGLQARAEELRGQILRFRAGAVAASPAEKPSPP